MKRLLLGTLVLLGAGAAFTFSGGKAGPGKPFFAAEERNPVSHLRWNDDPAEFQFALVSDRTGSHRADVFAQAVHKLNLLQPAFVLSVGDLIEGAKEDKKLTAQWQEFDRLVGQLQMPFFYVAGNHDTGSKESAKSWDGKLGRRHYHFVYRGVLFLMLNSDDPPGAGGKLADGQLDYARKVLKDNAAARWTVVIVHRPLWEVAGGMKNGWVEVEKALAGRKYTVFAGHIHHYRKFVRQGMNYYQLATTGGGSLLRGVEEGEFDQIAWVTMKKDGPVLANLLLGSVLPEDLQPIKTKEPGSVIANRKPTQPVDGKAYFQGVPITGAHVTFHPADTKQRKPVGVVAADGTFRLSTYQANDGAPAGEYQVTVVWRELDADGARVGANQLPGKYALPLTSGLRATVREGKNAVVLEMRK